MTYELPDIPYKYDAMEPYIDAMTMEIHYTKHHAGYVEKLNKALEGTDLEGLSIEDLMHRLEDVPADKKDLVRNNGGGHANHSLFWQILTSEKTEPEGELKSALERQFGSIEKAKDELSNVALNHFGSGWGWLVINKDNNLEAVSTANQDSPLIYGMTPILGIDVWEHAYYLKYQNKRIDYINAFWNVVNWKKVEENFKKHK